MGLNRKGIFFTILAIALVSFFVLSYTFYDEIQERKAIAKRVSSMNNFLLSAEEDLARQLYIANFRTIFLIEKNIIESGTYPSDLQSVFQESFFNGTINSQQQELLEGVTFSDIELAINTRSQKINAQFQLDNPLLNISQEDPWRVKVTLTTNLSFEDETDLALWNKTSVISVYIPIESFEDPLYYVSTSGLINQNITKTPYADFVSGSDISSLYSHAVNSYYKVSPTAPSFLQRLEGSSVASPYGIESIVNLQKLSQKGITVEQKSVVDYIYFSSSSPPSCAVSPAGMPSWFRLDDNHTSAYEVVCA